MKEYTVEEYIKNFKEAELVLKEIETSFGELTVVSLNDLRYAGNHISRYLEPEASSEVKSSELSKAIGHCRRAIFDAREMQISFYMEKIDQLIKYFDENTQETVSVLPDFVDYKQEFFEITGKFLEFTQLANEDNNNKHVTEKRMDYYEAVTKDTIVPLANLQQKLDIAYTNVKALVIKAQEERDNVTKANIAKYIQWGVIVIISIIGICVTIG